MPLPALAIAGLALGGAKTLAGGIQALFPGKKPKEPGPYEISEELKSKLERSYEAERTGMPEPSRMMALQGAEQAGIFGMRASRDRRGGLASIGDIQAGLFRAYGDLAQRDAEIRQRNFMLTQQALSEMNRAKDLKFQTDYMRYQNAEQRRRANIGAGLQNIMGGLDLAGSLFALGSGAGPGVGGSSYSPNARFLGGTVAPIFRSSYTPSAASMSLYRGTQPFSGFSLLNTRIP